MEKINENRAEAAATEAKEKSDAAKAVASYFAKRDTYAHQLLNAATPVADSDNSDGPFGNFGYSSDAFFDADPASEFGLSPAGKLKLGKQKNSGVTVSPPSQNEIDTAIKHQKTFDIAKEMHYTRALSEGKLQVLREGDTVTLTGKLSVFSAAGAAGAEQLIADINSRFQGLSHTSDGLTYKTDFSFSVAKARTGSDIRVDYFELPDDRGQAQYNGQIFLDKSADLPYLRKGVGAHEFAHTILGLPDGYHDITLKRPEGEYYLRGVPYKEQVNSLMSDTSKRIPGPDLQKIILKIEADIKGKR